MSAKKKYSGMTILQKLNAIRAVDKKIKSKSAVARELGIPRSTLSTYLRNRHSIEKQAAQGANINVRKRMRGGKHVALEKELLEWLCQTKEEKSRISATMVRTKAREIASNLGLDFQCSNGWFHRFQHRYNIGVSSRAKSAAALDHTQSSICDPSADGGSRDFSTAEVNIACSDIGESSNAGPSENTPVTNGSHRPLPLDFHSGDPGPEKKRIRLDAHPDVEECLFFWYVQAHKQNLPITGQILQEKAAEFAQLLGHESRQFTDAWINKFKFKRGIALKKQRDDFLPKPSTSSSSEATENPHTKQFDLTSYYPQEDIFTVTETGLLSKLLPDEKPEEWSSKILRSVDGEFSEERLTLMMVCNMDGTEKLPLVVIGNNEEGKDLGVAISSIEYVKNPSSWLTSSIIKDWILRLEQKMKDAGRKIALVTENSLFRAVSGKLSNVKVFVRAPHSAKYVTLQRSKIVSSLKLRYRRALLAHIVKCLKAGEDSSLSFTDFLCWLATAWMDIKPEVFAGANSLRVQDTEEQDMMNDCQRMIEDVRRQRGEAKDIESFPAESYITVDDQLCTMGFLSPQEIADVLKKYNSFSATQDESVTLSSFYADESLISQDKPEKDGVRSFSKSPNPDVTEEIIIPHTDSALSKITFPSAVSLELLRDNSFSPRSTISEGGSCVELSFVVESADSRTDIGSDFTAINQELEVRLMEPVTEDAVVLQAIHSQESTNGQESDELADSSASGHVSAHNRQLCNDRSSLPQNTRHATDTTSKDIATSSSGNTLPHSRIPPPSVHVLPNKVVCGGGNPTAAEAMSALMLVHSYIFSKPNANDVVKDSFCHLVRFLGDSVIEESLPKKK